MKFKAFTILETIITLVISSLIISFVYQIYSTVSQQFRHYERLQGETINFNQFNTVFTKDVSLCQYIQSVTSNEIRLKFSNKDVEYFFEDHYVVRHGKYKDTFKVNVNTINWQPWSGKTKIASETIRLKTTVSGRSILVFEKKQIDIATGINNEFAE